MTESQRKFLTKYIGREDTLNITFTNLYDKQDLLEAVIAKGEWFEFEAYSTNIHGDNDDDDFFNAWLIKLSPIETAELVCWWKGEK
jgi:hypothetical protein